MSDIKSLFEQNKAQKVLSDASLNQVGRTVESADYVKEEVAFQNKVIPYINFDSASNFARYGSAEKYYEDSINYVKNEWPYDGSKKEKIQWQLSSSYLDRYIFDNLYPRTTGYVNIGNDYGTITPDVNGYDISSKIEYIRIKGSSNIPTGSTTLREDFNKYNMYNTSSQGLYTTELNGDKGYSVEFWFKKDGYVSGSESEKQVFFDLWNSSSVNEGRLKIEADMSATPNVFTVNVKSGSAEFAATLGSSLDITGSDWHHYSFTFANSGSSTVSKLYVDGDLNDSSTATDSIGLVTGSMIANIGAMIAAYDSSGSANAGKLSGSLDEFRYWKSTRTEEEIGRNWFCQVDGGTNSDIQNIATSSAKYSYENPVDLGVYYKFNEGIINSSSTNSTDARVLDYSGRVTNGSWVGYAVGARFTGSAMVESSASLSEFRDPIIYSSHPSVVALLEEKKNEGREHDFYNNANVYKSIPSWIINDDQQHEVNQGVLLNLTQIMASYFDTLQLQIEALPSLKDNDYISGSDKPLPFANRLVDNLGLTTSEIFSNATDLEYLASKDDFRKFSAKLNETKNIVYQNVYNNLSYIYKSKGTEKSFRNLIRCFGVDDELININLYGNNVTFELLDNTENTIVQKRYADFSNSQNFEATVFQSSSATNTNSRSYISASDEMTFRGLTFESEVHFPKQFPIGSQYYNPSNSITSSLFGCHTSDTANAWSSPDSANFQVQSIREEKDSKNAYFRLTGTAGAIFPQLTSSVFKDVYDDSRWLFALKIKPSTHPLADGVPGSGDSPDYDISFAGYNYVLDVLVNSFEVTSSVPYASGSAFANANKRMFVGAHRTNFTGSVLEYADVESTSLRAWMDYVDSEVIKAHARDVLNFGPERPNRNAYITQLSKSIGDNIANIPQLESLALHWNFDNVTGSDGSGQFTVDDFSSGSVALTNRWGWLGPISKYQHTGLGYGFEASSTTAIDRRYVHSAQQQLPEALQSGDMVSIIDDTTNQIFSRDSRPVDYNFAFEKSMYRIISQDMLKYFATMADFNNLIGAPINRYRQQYKDMENFRQLYFERIGNDPDFDKFVEYFKWIDSAIVTMLLQLAPASSRFNDRLRNMVESHVLERSKYWNKFPTLEMKVSDPIGGISGLGELLYPWSRGHAPISNLQKDNCLWWSDRARRQNSVITSGDSNVDADRETIRLSNDFRSGSVPTLAVSRDSTATTTTYQGQAYAIRNFTKPYRLVVDESPEIHGGSNFPRAKKVEYTHASLNVGSATQLQVTASDFDFEKDCDDVINPNAKERLETKVQNTSDSEGYKSGKSTILAPFSLFSSSVDTGYASQVASNFRANTEIANYHDDSYGDDKGTPMQGPFTQDHVGGRQHRHVNFREQTVADRPEAWNLAISSQNMTISSRTVSQPRATMIRDEYAKRALNLRNIKWGTGSFVAGNYRKDYEMIQTSDRNINDRYFVKAEGQQPIASDSPFLTGTIDYALPRFDLTGTNDYIFVERFNAPGGQDVSSRGMLDWKSEQFAIYNDLNFRNLGVRRPLNEWYTEHSERFGIKSGSSVRELDYNTLASYHKVNRNPRHTVEENNSCSVDYDNWWVQHAIPQSVYQYAWVTASVTKSECDTFGYVSNFSVPSGSTSTTQSAVPFISSSSWEFPNITNGQNYPVNFVNMLPELPGTDPSEYKYRLSALQGILEPEWGITTNLQVTENGTKIKKTTPNGWNGSAASNLIISGKGYYQFTTDQTDAYIVTGLNDHPPAVTTGSTHLDVITDMEFAIGLRPIPDGVGNVAIWEDGVNVANFPIPYEIGWSFRIQKDNSTIKYLHDNGTSDWTLFHTSTKSAPLLLGPDVAIYNQNASYSNIKVYIEDGNLVAPGPSFVSASGLADSASINAHINNLNGPYQYPSWKQTRTGETPVVRYHKNNNILSISSSVRSDTFTNFVEPPVTFKYKPLLTSFGENQPKIRSTYANNEGKFSLGINLTQSIQDFTNIVDRNDEQVYDTMLSVADLRSAITANRYSEVIYPREMLTGLAETRGRTNYSEVATVDLNNSASLSAGSNGIDRGPLLRRTFWRDSEALRNRRSGFNMLTSSGDGIGGYYVTSTLPNSQDINDGLGTSVYGMGNTPFHYRLEQFTFPLGVDPIGNRILMEDLYGKTTTSDPYPSDYPDTGELNSVDVNRMYGYNGTFSYSEFGKQSLSSKATWYPTASAMYYHYPILGIDRTVPSNKNSGKADFLQEYINTPLRWRVSELSGKYPWFDSYEEYSSDISKMAKNFTIIPEFRMSQHMEYYISQSEGNFSAQNDKFLTLDGANITASADTEKSTPRAFNENFFNEYSNTDFQKYFGKFTQDSQLNTVSLKCNAVKKLLPYHGFYPINRTIQLSSMFSKSVGPYISGISWKDGATTNASNPASGALAIQSSLQPFFAPGILYNTIKSGIAVDWGTYTGSSYTQALPGTASSGVGQLAIAPNYRMSFESILDPLGESGIPNNTGSSITTDSRMYWASPTYAIGNDLGSTYYQHQTASATTWASPRLPYAEITGTARSQAADHPNYSLYQLAMNNFLSEIPNFFLNNPGGNLSKIVSSKAAGEITLTPGKNYYMDIFLNKSRDLVMFKDYMDGERNLDPGGNSAFRTLQGQYHSVDGRMFGPPVSGGVTRNNAQGVTEMEDIFQNLQSSLCFAPYTPPYYHGESIVTLKYTAVAGDDVQGGFNWGRFFNNLTATYSNPELERRFDVLDTSLISPAQQGAMSISASINFKGTFNQPVPEYDSDGNIIKLTNNQDPKTKKWVISPRMETPVLDFSDQPTNPVNIDGEYESMAGANQISLGYTRGMWSGYGSPSSSKKIQYGIKDTFSPLNSAPSNSESLLDIMFENAPKKKAVGQLKEEKNISEAIVAIPYVTEEILPAEEYATTTNVLGNKQFFEISSKIYSPYKKWLEANKATLDQEGVSAPDPSPDMLGDMAPSQSIIKMLTLGRKYILPPELDFIYNSSGDNKVNPYVMYIFEFNHKLKKQDLVDIWQGVMPEISRTAEVSNEEVDDNNFSHPLEFQEFFHGKKIPDNVRWMVFKVKRRANFDYYKVTDDTKDDSRFRDSEKFNVNNGEITYSYNWPYDYFSLVELAQIETNNDFGEPEE